MCVRITVHNCHTQYSTEQFNSSDNIPSLIHQRIVARMLSTAGMDEFKPMRILNYHYFINNDYLNPIHQ